MDIPPTQIEFEWRKQIFATIEDHAGVVEDCRRNIVLEHFDQLHVHCDREFFVGGNNYVQQYQPNEYESQVTT
jgi:hypothetical protein